MIRDIAAAEALHRTLLGALDQLDRLGCLRTAAHIASAIDALEQEMQSPFAERPTIASRDYAIALCRQVGDRAEVIVRQQIKLAEGDVLRTWSAILAHLQAVEPER